MNEIKATEKEYEALAVIRDILILLYSEICENLGRDSTYLSDAFNSINELTEEAAKNLIQ